MVLYSILGVVSGRSCWGLEPWDLRPSRSKAVKQTASGKDDDESRDIESRESRAQPHSTDGLREVMERAMKDAKRQGEAAGKARRAASLAKIWHTPLRRHVWGEKQYQLSASWGELFLDLIIVGAAYRLGLVVKYSFCEGDASGSGSASGSAAAASASASASASARMPPPPPPPPPPRTPLRPACWPPHPAPAPGCAWVRRSG